MRHALHVSSREWFQSHDIGTEIPAVHARYIDHRFARHAHEHCAVGLIEAGVQSFRCRGATHVTPADHVFCIDGEDAHTGEPAVAGGYVYWTIYPTPGELQAVARTLYGRSIGRRRFSGAVLADATLSSALQALRASAVRGGDALETETRCLGVLSRLVARHSVRRAPAPARRDDHSVQTARDFLDAHFNVAVTLAEVAAACGRSPFHLARVFEAQVGMPPHVYVEMRRIQQARRHLQDGLSLAQIAYSVGYPDQSHFTRRFKAACGVTPGRYRTLTVGGVRGIVPIHQQTTGPGGPLAGCSADSHRAPAPADG